MDSAGDIDRISALPDDLLHAILAGVGEATAVTRTAVLSKRWRRAWVHAQHLELEDTKVCRVVKPADCFAGFVDWVFACRGDAGIGSLEISMSRHDCCASSEHVNGWLRCAMRRVVKSFRLQLPNRHLNLAARILGDLQGLQLDEPAVVLPSHGRMASIEMRLSHRTFQLPVVAAAARYEALTELVLCSPSFDSAAAPPSGGQRTLGDFVSSCCPRLRKLQVTSPSGLLPQLVIRSETLQELTLSLAGVLHTLDVAAPSLLKLDLCFHDRPSSFVFDGGVIGKRVARIAARTPRLEEIAIRYPPGRRLPNLDIHGTASVRRLNKVHLHMHGPYCVDDDNLRLLNNCPGVEHIDVSLEHEKGATNSGLVDLTAEGAASFADVRSMVVKAPLFSRGQLVSSISSLLSRCPLLRSLRIHITETIEELLSGAKCFCDEVDTWRFHQKFFLGSLEEVTIHGFVGANEDMELLTLLFESSSSIRKVTIHATAKYPDSEVLKRMMAEDDEDDTETAHTKLTNIPFSAGGCWHFGEEDVYTWTCYTTLVHSEANSVLN